MTRRGATVDEQHNNVIDAGIEQARCRERRKASKKVYRGRTEDKDPETWSKMTAVEEKDIMMHSGPSLNSNVKLMLGCVPCPRRRGVLHLKKFVL